jgi:predicted NBD/HSP70 family sugar kinase
MTQYIAVDIGGTQIRAAILSLPIASNPDSHLERPATRHPYQTPLERLEDLIASIWPS